MKRILFLLTFVSVLVLSACGNNEDKLTVVATPVPHAEILEEAKPLLEERGIKLDVKVVNDYVTPNKLLESEDADATFFAHIPYFNNLVENEGFDFVNLGAVHLEPIGAYSNDYDSFDALPDGAKIFLSNNVADEGRILKFFTDRDLITLKEGVDPITARVEDIDENPHNFDFNNTTAPEIMAKAYENNEADVFFINANFAIDAGITPAEDAIELESADSEYVNIVIARTADENNEQLKELLEVLRSEEIQKFIEENYNGAVIPAE
ncbi:MetQ/NlpA family ABC transporter substrate-binding protein [Phocicoccus pinnipedialis]|uniref:Lipoprotein n=1 Tax=Phocicoccus pinnipedialis TaxID=110845 RepID=A0A6V7R781_9BACL|nr:MetQ/NlpA family ABC transporter substrate-binding protein [Jeotgalicoccus pinnipedialis]MBP1938852.1 D-methionine transport system substrate-binding protein [Jeotgalicoccus pinnipedialis]CAD2073310.1 Methionine-binding lipoprotein MetQ precursor [Jeotgalicoccus pinnipedialis]